MAVAVSLRAVVEELGSLIDASTAYVNRETGEVLALLDDETRLVEDSVDPEDLLEWQRDDVPRIREVLESGDWLPLPTRFDIHEWAIMDKFASSVDYPALRDELRHVIRGAAAFRGFKDAIHRQGIQESWYGFRTSALEGIAADWLDENGVSYIRDEGARPEGWASNQGIERTPSALD